MAKEKGGDTTLQKWKDKGYLEDMDDVDGAALAALMEAAETDLKNENSYTKGLLVNTSAGKITFNISDILFKTIRESFDEKADNKMTLNNNAFLSSLETECANMAESFYGSVGGVSQTGLFDPSSHEAFAAKIGTAYAIAT